MRKRVIINIKDALIAKYLILIGFLIKIQNVNSEVTMFLEKDLFDKPIELQLLRLGRRHCKVAYLGGATVWGEPGPNSTDMGTLQDGNRAILHEVYNVVRFILCINFKYYDSKFFVLENDQLSRIVFSGLLSIIFICIAILDYKEIFILRLCEYIILASYPFLLHLIYISARDKTVIFLNCFSRHLKKCQKITKKGIPLSLYLLVSLVLKIIGSVSYFIYISYDYNGSQIDMYIIIAISQVIVNMIVLPMQVQTGGICLIVIYHEFLYANLNERLEKVLLEVKSYESDCRTKKNRVTQIQKLVSKALKIIHRLQRTLQLLNKFSDLIENCAEIISFLCYLFVLDTIIRYCSSLRPMETTSFAVCPYYLLTFLDFGFMTIFWKNLGLMFRKTNVLIRILEFNYNEELTKNVNDLVRHALIFGPNLTQRRRPLFLYGTTLCSVSLLGSIAQSSYWGAYSETY